MELTDGARTLLGNLGYDPTYGARPLKRVIQKRLVDPLALAILEGRFVPGDTVRVDAVEGELVSGEGRGDRGCLTDAAAVDQEQAPLARNAAQRLIPRKLNAMLEPTTRSRTVPDTSTSLGSARSAMRAPMWTVTRPIVAR